MSISKTLILLSFLACASRLDAQWVQTDGPYGGPIIEVAVHGNDVFSGADSGTVYRLTADGKRWLRTNGVLPNSAVHSLASSGDYLFVGLYDGGLYRSSDKGESWTLMNAEIRSRPLYTIEIVDQDVFAATDERLYRSTDDGLTWAYAGYRQHFPNSGLFVVKQDLYAPAPERGYWRSTDNGLTWTAFDVENAKERLVGVISIGDSAVAATLDGMFVRVAQTDVWRRTALPFIGAIPTAIIGVGDTLVLTCADKGVYRSTDLGATWSKSSMIRWMPSTISNFAARGSQLFATCASGIVASTDFGASWNPLNAGIWRAHVVSITENERYVFAATSMHGVFRSRDEGAVWQQIAHNWVMPSWITAVQAVATTPTTIMVTALVAGHLVSSDNGDTWTNSTLIDANLVSLFPRGTELFGGSWYKGIYRSLDGGRSFEPYGGDSTSTIYAMTADDSTLYMSDSKPPYFFHKHDSATTAHDSLGRHFRSTDTTLQDSASMNTDWWSIPMAETSIWIVSIAVRDSILFAACENNALHQLNLHSGEWTAVDSTILPKNIVSLAVIDTSILAATENDGIYLSSDNGITWIPVSDSTGPTTIACMFVGTNNLYIGTRTQGVWRCGLAEVILPVTVPTEVSHQPLTLKTHPNPFDSRTTITFVVHRSGPVTLNIFNSQGELAANLFSGHMEAGSKTVEWNARGLTRGLYYVQLLAGGGSRTTVMHVLH